MVYFHGTIHYLSDSDMILILCEFFSWMEWGIGARSLLINNGSHSQLPTNMTVRFILSMDIDKRLIDNQATEEDARETILSAPHRLCVESIPRIAVAAARRHKMVGEDYLDVGGSVPGAETLYRICAPANVLRLPRSPGKAHAQVTVAWLWSSYVAGVRRRTRRRVVYVPSMHLSF
jgi:hypothetical protein